MLEYFLLNLHCIPLILHQLEVVVETYNKSVYGTEYHDQNLIEEEPLAWIDFLRATELLK